MIACLFSDVHLHINFISELALTLGTGSSIHSLRPHSKGALQADELEYTVTSSAEAIPVGKVGCTWNMVSAFVTHSS